MNLLRKYRKALFITLATVLVSAACLFSFFAGGILYSSKILRNRLEAQMIWDLGLHDRIKTGDMESALPLLSARLVDQKRTLLELEDSALNVVFTEEEFPHYLPEQIRQTALEQIDAIHETLPREGVSYKATGEKVYPPSRSNREPSRE